MEKVRAKFKCDSIQQYQFFCVVRFGSSIIVQEDNDGFIDAAPCENFSIVIKGNPLSVGFFKPGEDYYIDFSKAER